MYDHIIIGAGSAGCVLASRLSEDPACRVLLLEAGGPDVGMPIRAPGLSALLFRSEHDWELYTEAQAGVDGRRMYWPRGKVLGGSSSINAMVYMRGHASCYDEWRDAGNAGWGWEEVLPYFKRSERWHGAPSEWHGTSGTLDVTAPPYIAPISEAFIEATVRRCGVPRREDFNGPDNEGAGAFHYTVRDGRRWSAAMAFLHPAMERANLEVVTGAHVAGLILEGARVTGVRWTADRRERTAALAPGGELILSAGAVGTPHILQLSGIGPKEALERAGVRVVADLPVGENMQDHLMALLCYDAHPGAVPVLGVFNLLAWTARYALTGAGRLRKPPLEAGAFLKTRPDLPRPDLQLHFMPWGFDDPNTDAVRPLPFGRQCTFFVGLIHPRSRGRIRLRDADPLSPPAVEPDYFTAEEDMRVLVDGMRLCREIAATEPFRCLRRRETRPGLGARTDAAIRAGIRRSVNTIFHPVGTAKMGTGDDAVVDPELRVRGIDGLRVVDGSVMPTIVGANTNAPIIMIAERAADLIRGRS